MDEMKKLLALDEARTIQFDFMTGLGDSDPRWDQATAAWKKAEAAFKAQWDSMGMTMELWLVQMLTVPGEEQVQIFVKERST